MTRALIREPEAVTVLGHDGVTLNVWDYGGEGIPLLLCHCTGTLGRIWDPVVSALGDQFRVLAPDTRGQGDSEAPPTREDYRWDFSGKDLLAILKHFDLPSGVGAVGHSAGGAHVGYAALAAPDSFGRIMLMDAVVADRQFFQGDNPLAEKVRRRRNQFDSLDAARARLSSKPPMAHWHPGSVAAYLAHAFLIAPDGSCALKCPGTREAWFYELGGASDLYEALGDIALPTALVTGEHSYGQAWVEAQQARLSDARIDVVPGAGHFMPQEKPDETAALIAAWFGQ